jgi:uncharacterized protein YegL
MVSLPRGVSMQGRKTPLLVLADVSESMKGNKISSLNQALQDMIQELQADQVAADTVLLSLITFNSQAREICNLEPVGAVQPPALSASGATAMGQAFRLALAQLSDRRRLPASCAVPTIVLLSDGQPNDDWRQPLSELQAHPLASRAVRLALAIGTDADRRVLGEFIGDPEVPVLQADDASKIQSFFRWVSLHTRSRSRGELGLPEPQDLLP